MLEACLPENEIQRLEKLRMYQILDTAAEDSFDRITRIVSETLDVPIALVSLIDRERQWFKSKQGLDVSETDRRLAFCAHAILGDELFEVPNALEEERFYDNPLVANEPSIRFYAGVPLRTPDGLNMGTLCAIDRVPRELTEQQRSLLEDLAKIVIDQMELRVAIKTALKAADIETRANALKDEFISNVTHELRTPLTSITGSLRLINGGAMGAIPEKLVDPLLIADRNAASLHGLINELLDIQKLGSGHMAYDIEPVLISQLIDEACQNIQSSGIERNIKIRFSPLGDAVIAADPKRIHQVMANILSNAIKHSPNGGEIDVSLEVFDAFVTISVSDQGAGVPEGFVPSLFDKFTQANRKTDMSGTGLGLSICKTIVDAHQGNIRIDTRVESGAKFLVELPTRQTVIPQ